MLGLKGQDSLAGKIDQFAAVRRYLRGQERQSQSGQARQAQ